MVPHQKPELLRNMRRNLILDNYNKNKDVQNILSPVFEVRRMSNAGTKGENGIPSDPIKKYNHGNLPNKFKKFNPDFMEQSPPIQTTKVNMNNIKLATGQTVLQDTKLGLSRPLWWG